MKLPKGRPPVYTGNISSSGFNLGKLLNDTMMGYVSLDAKLKGAGFNPEKGNVALETKVNYFDYNKYRYQNIRFDGDVNRNNFNGNASIDDPNIKLTLNGSIDSRKAIPEFDFLSHIDHLNFKPLNLIKDNISLSGKANAHFSGKTIDDFLGRALFRLGGHPGLPTRCKLRIPRSAIAGDIVTGKRCGKAQTARRLA